MAWGYLQYRDPLVRNNLDALYMWLSNNTHLYFAVKEFFADSWIYFAGNTTHELGMDYELTGWGSESSAATYYLSTIKDAGDLVVVRFPSFQVVSYIRVYFDGTVPTTIRRFFPGFDKFDYFQKINSLYMGNV